MLTRLKDILTDFFRQADLVLLALCCVSTLFGMVLIASASGYMGLGKVIRYVGVQGVALLLGVCVYIALSMVDFEILMKKWKWLVLFNIVFIGLLLTPFGVSDNTGNTAWLKFPGIPFSIGPAEVVKISFTLLLAKQIEWLRVEKRDLKSFRAALDKTISLHFLTSDRIKGGMQILEDIQLSVHQVSTEPDGIGREIIEHLAINLVLVDFLSQQFTDNQEDRRVVGVVSETTGISHHTAVDASGEILA